MDSEQSTPDSWDRVTTVTTRWLDTERSGWQSSGMTKNATAAKPEQVYEIFDPPEYPADRFTITLKPEDSRRGPYVPFIAISSTGGGYYHDEFINMATYYEWRYCNLARITDWEDLPENVRNLVEKILDRESVANLIAD